MTMPDAIMLKVLPGISVDFHLSPLLLCLSFAPMAHSYLLFLLFHV